MVSSSTAIREEIITTFGVPYLSTLAKTLTESGLFNFSITLEGIFAMFVLRFYPQFSLKREMKKKDFICQDFIKGLRLKSFLLSIDFTDFTY